MNVINYAIAYAGNLVHILSNEIYLDWWIYCLYVPNDFNMFSSLGSTQVNKLNDNLKTFVYKYEKWLIFIN